MPVSTLGRVTPRWSASPGAALAVMGLAVATAAAWAVLPHLDMMTAAPALFLLAWSVMMAAMMLPSVAPLVLIHPRGGRASLVLGYLFVWAAVGVPVFVLSRIVDLIDVPTVAVAGVRAPINSAASRTSACASVAARWTSSPCAGDGARCDWASSTGSIASGVAGR
ncbi:MAG: DUF2182 domain-containing protein [Actinobacteria bacterium]|nr:MAG: DUF2182 domain-containing protein [Actinomycetota bacterium]